MTRPEKVPSQRRILSKNLSLNFSPIYKSLSFSFSVLFFTLEAKCTENSLISPHCLMASTSTVTSNTYNKTMRLMTSTTTTLLTVVTTLVGVLRNGFKI